MKRYFSAACFLVFLFSCKSGSKSPDVSAINISLTTQRFERDFFDTSSVKLAGYLRQMNADSNTFLKNYLIRILGVDPKLSIDSSVKELQGFIRSYNNVYDTAEKIFADFTPYENEIKKGLQHVKYYFPNYKLPQKIITYIGPADGYGDALANEGILIGLHHHLGKNFALYKTDLVNAFYPAYITDRFDPDHITVNCLKNIVDDMYPEKEDDSPLINQMIEKGKRLYLLKMFYPDAEEHLLTGYTKQQLKDCYKNEAVIWNLFVKNGYLQSIDKDMVKNYLQDGPKTPELGEDSPGNIGSFAGWQIVKKYMQKNVSVTLPQLMEKDDEMIFQETKYKP